MKRLAVSAALAFAFIVWRMSRAGRGPAQRATLLFAGRQGHDALVLDGVLHPGAGEEAHDGGGSPFSLVAESPPGRQADTLIGIVQRSRSGLPVEVHLVPSLGRVRLMTEGGPILLRLRLAVGLPSGGSNRDGEAIYGRLKFVT